MARHADDVAERLSAARAGSADAFGQALQSCRRYLLLVAREEFGEDLKAKGGASDMVQETFLKAHRHFGRFRGETEEELLAWLRRLLLNNLASFRRLFVAEKRAQAAEEALEGGDSAWPAREFTRGYTLAQRAGHGPRARRGAARPSGNSPRITGTS